MAKSAWYLVAGDILARDLWVTVPLDWQDPLGEKIRVFARELIDAETPREVSLKKPAIIYLQGGPGGKGNRPYGRDPFLAAALKKFRVVLADQRGTGRSAPVQAETVARMTAAEGAKFLSLFRSDSIIKDFEEIRKQHFDGQKWWTMGQSYGGFLTLHYLSVAPEAIVASVVTGGLPSIDPDPEAVYKATVERVRQKNEDFFTRFAHLRDRVDKIADILASKNITTQYGDRLTVKRFQTLGVDLGMQAGHDRLHWLLDEAFVDAEETVLSDFFVHEVASATSFATNPLFMVLQESIYGQGPSNWAAGRQIAQEQDFSDSARPLLFTGEMAFKWMADELATLKPFGAAWKELAKNEWPIDLYGHEQLAKNTVPVEAIVYLNDMYVESAMSFDTADRVKGLNIWVTNEYEHDGIRAGNVFERLVERLEIRVNSVN